MAKYIATRFLIAGFLAASLLLAADPLPADTIYMWIDDQGIKHFSNLPPPKGVGQTFKIETRTSTLPCEGSKPRRRAYDQMVEEYQDQAAQMENDSRRAIERQSAREQLNRKDQLDEKVRYERQRLEYQIQQLRRRAVSPTYSQGMRSGQIQALEEQRQMLVNDPQRYFRNAE